MVKNKEKGRALGVLAVANAMAELESAAVDNVAGAIKNLGARGAGARSRMVTSTPARAGVDLRTTRPVGIEIETFIPVADDETTELLTEDITHSIVKGDGSIDEPCGCAGVEIATYPLVGDAGERALASVCDTLARYDADVNTSCGLHVHVDCSDILKNAARNGDKLAKVLALFAALEPTMYSLVPQSRSRTTYSQRLPSVRKARLATYSSRTTFSELIGNASGDSERTRAVLYALRGRPTSEYKAVLDQIKRRLSNEAATRVRDLLCDDTRYRWYNTQALYEYGTLEVRLHSGTTQYEKIVRWANLCARLVDAVARDRVSWATIGAQARKRTTRTRLAGLYYIADLNDSEKAYLDARAAHFASGDNETQ